MLSRHSIPLLSLFRRLVEIQSHRANELKYREAAQYLSELDENKTNAFYGSLPRQDAVNLTVAVVTVGRSGASTLGYLTQVVAEIDKIFKAHVNLKKVAFICNTFAEPGQHEEAEDLARNFPVNTCDQRHLREGEERLRLLPTEGAAVPDEPRDHDRGGRGAAS